MSEWEALGKSDDWYTPKHVFDALTVNFDLDVAAPIDGPRHVPCKRWISRHSLSPYVKWRGFIWMNPPFGGRNSLSPWLDKFFQHSNGIALTPDRTSAPWWQDAAAKADLMLLTRGKIKFERPDGTIGSSPGFGVTLWGAGAIAVDALKIAKRNGLGSLWLPFRP